MPEFITLLITSCNRAAQLRENLELIFAQDYPRSLFEVVVMDDASTDGTWPLLTGLASGGRHKNLRTLRNERNLGIVSCRQELFKQISPRSGLALVMDDDVSLPGGFLSALAAYMEKDQRIGALGPRVVYKNDPERAAHYPNFVNFVTGFYSSKDPSEAMDCDWLISCCLALRKEALDRTGGFDVSFVNSHEEADLCLRIKSLGYRVVYQPHLCVKHDIAEKKRKIDRFYYMYRNKFLVIRKNFPFPWKVTATLAVLFLGFPKYLLESVVFNRGVVLSEWKTVSLAVLDGLRGRGGRFTA